MYVFAPYFRFLASGDSYHTLAGRFRIAYSTVSLIIPKVCEVIWNLMVEIYMLPPTEETWKEIEFRFRTRWNFPNCCGAIDGKHVALRKPANSGSLYFNYKNHFSVVLMALVDHAYKFIYVDVGNYGSNSDLGIFKHSAFGLKFMANELQMPPPKMLPGFPQAGLLPHCIVGDEAFPLRPDIMKPYPRGQRGIKLPEDQLVFNYRLSRARRISENAFGILVQRWRVFDRRMAISDENTIKVIQAATVLHNYLKPAGVNPEVMLAQLNPNGREYDNQGGALRNINHGGIRSPTDAIEIRDWYKAYFFSPVGSIPYQMERVSYM